MDGPREELRRMLAAVVERGAFTLASGRTSDYYLDGRRVTLDGRGAHLIARTLLPLVRAERATVVAGLTMGADPIVTAVALWSAQEGTPIQAAIVRKEAKGHGTGRQIEGPPLAPGARAVVVDDVLTTGGSLLAAAEALRAAGAVVARAIVLVDRDEGGREAVEAAGIPVTALFRRADLVGPRDCA